MPICTILYDVALCMLLFGRIQVSGTTDHLPQHGRASRPLPVFNRNTATEPDSTRLLALFKAQHEGECCGCESMRSPCATAIVAVLRFADPREALVQVRSACALQATLRLRRMPAIRPDRAAVAIPRALRAPAGYGD